jgi:hypothetical protein
MQVYGFVGPSGTGKSSLAISLCHKLRIQDFIDDGLYIHRGEKKAGISAKYENNTFTAVKRAIFYYPNHREEVRRAITALQPERLLIIGTSKRMISRIAQALELPAPSQWLTIDEVSTPDQIQRARFSRQIYGQHVIPIPRIQVENDRFHQLIEKVKAIFDTESKKTIGETTIVHPRFQGGKVEIKKSCLEQIIRHNLKLNEQVRFVAGLHVPLDLFEPISIHLSLYDGYPILDTCKSIQAAVAAIFEQMLNISIPLPNIYVVHLEIRHPAFAGKPSD